ncbi:hypothetical protein M3J09_000619 [Ascochyta lentis]
MIWDFLCSESICGIPNDLVGIDVSGVINDRMIYHHFELFQKIPRCKGTASTAPLVSLEPGNTFSIRNEELACILSSAPITLFRKMLQTGMFRPNRLGPHAPLNLDMYSRRRDMVDFLLTQRADVNACDAYGVWHLPSTIRGEPRPCDLHTATYRTWC